MDLKALILKKLAGVIEEETKNLVLTTCKSHEEYRQAVGHIHGLLLAIDIINDTYSEYIGS